jgi:hypothetical protein
MELMVEVDIIPTEREEQERERAIIQMKAILKNVD